MAQAVLGAFVAKAQGNSAAAGAAGAATGELIAATLYPNTKTADLTDEQRQTVSALSTLAAGLAGGLAGGDAASAMAGAQAGQNAVDNNHLSDIERVSLDMDRKNTPRDVKALRELLPSARSCVPRSMRWRIKGRAYCRRN
ncbi:VENN motif pre-toxin domain-containing protein [Pseudomonas sp. KNUC1026]|nr:VENN motif pre-toxin domain-containing protein [Pseudomonas sp. KNUC1026]